MYVDSHCHLNFPVLAVQLPMFLERMAVHQVMPALAVSVNLPEWPGLLGLALSHDNLWVSAGVHPDYEGEAVQEVAAKMPLDRLLIETDSPYLAPVPSRGELNGPSKVVYVAEKIAELKGITPAEVGRAI